MKRTALALLLLTAVTLPGCTRGCQNPARKPLGPKLEFIAYYENGWGGMFPSSFPTLERNHRYITVLSPLWFSLDPDGAIRGGTHQEDVARFARQKDLRLVVLITAEKRPGTDRLKFLRDAESRRTAVRSITDLVRDKDYDGVNIDVGAIPAELRDEHTDFVRQLSRAMRGRILAVSVLPKLDVPEKAAGGYDYLRLGSRATYVVLSAYDKHFSDTEPGPVAPLPWIKRNLEYAVERIPRNKLVLLIGAFGYDWPVPPSTGVPSYTPAKDLIRRAKERGAEIKWDDESQQPHYTYVADGIKRQVWFQSADSSRQRIRLAKQFNIRGVAFWRLGLEEPRFWEAVDETIGPKP